MKTAFLTLALVIGASILPSTTTAQTPDPVLKAFEALESGQAYKTNLSGNSTTEILDISLEIGTKGSSYTDANGNTEGKLTMSFNSNDGKKKSKMSIGMQFKFFKKESLMYFKFDKLPKDASSDLDEIKSGVWYVSTVGNASQLFGENYLTGGNFQEAQSKYPAFSFIEKGSTKKEYVYTYSTNKALLSGFLSEQARLNGISVGAPETNLLVSIIGSMKGSFIVNKKTGLLSKVTQRLGGNEMSIENTATYKFGGSGKVKKPSKSTQNNSILESFLPQL